MNLTLARNFLNLLNGCSLTSILEIEKDRVIEENSILGDYAYVFAIRVEG